MGNRVIGIDLGTTNCCVAVVERFSAQVIANRGGYKTTPSILAVTQDGRRLVGQTAARQAVTNPEHTVYATKRLIGRTFESEEVRHAYATVSYRLVSGAQGDVRVVMGDKAFTIPELSAMLLQEMRIIAEDHLGETVDRAVVTVPAYFNDNQRQAVRDAGQIAGLEVLAILNEPTAAAIAYGFGRDEDITLAVYDLGGGTFDVSIVKLSKEGTFRVVATTGDSYLGGEDFDARIVDWLMKRVEAAHGVDLTGDPVVAQRLREAAAKAKCDLSTLEKVEIALPFLATRESGEPLHLQEQLTRKELESLTGDLVTRTLDICEKAMRFAKLKPRDIDEVILVGGMTRMPSVQWAVRELFDRTPSKGVHPDEVVAIGAALHAATLEKDDASALPTLEDVTAHSLGIMTAAGGFDVVVPTNSPVPVEVRSRFTTSRNDQDRVKIVVLQGESEAARENTLLGQFALTNLRPAPAGAVEVEVSFRIDDDGLFSVSAVDLESGQEQTIEVTATSGLSDAELRQLAQNSAAYLAERRAEEHAEETTQIVETLVAELERVLPGAQLSLSSSPVGLSMLANAWQAVSSAKEALAAKQPMAIAAQVSPLNLSKSGLLELMEDS